MGGLADCRGRRHSVFVGAGFGVPEPIDRQRRPQRPELDRRAVAVGSRPTYVVVEGGRIPSSGPVDLRSWNSTLVYTGVPIALRGTLAGVPGALTRSLNGAPAAFVRDQPGPSVDVPSGSQLVIDPADRDQWVNVFWVGRQGFATPDTTLADLADAVAFLKTAPRRFIVMSILNAGPSRAASQAYAQIASLNAELARRYPDNFWISAPCWCRRPTPACRPTWPMPPPTWCRVHCGSTRCT